MIDSEVKKTKKNKSEIVKKCNIEKFKDYCIIKTKKYPFIGKIFSKHHKKWGKWGAFTAIAFVFILWIMPILWSYVGKPIVCSYEIKSKKECIDNLNYTRNEKEEISKNCEKNIADTKKNCEKNISDAREERDAWRQAYKNIDLNKLLESAQNNENSGEKRNKKKGLLIYENSNYIIYSFIIWFCFC